MVGRSTAYQGVDGQLPDMLPTPSNDDINLPMLDPDLPKSSELREKELLEIHPPEILSPAASGEDEEKASVSKELPDQGQVSHSCGTTDKPYLGWVLTSSWGQLFWESKRWFLRIMSG